MDAVASGILRYFNKLQKTLALAVSRLKATVLLRSIRAFTQHRD